MKIKKSESVQIENVVGHTCDVCKKTVMERTLPKEWYSFSSHHDEWGNDSIESYEDFDVCSVRCYMDQLYRCVGEMEGKEATAEIDNKSYHFVKTMLEYYNHD